MDCHLYFASTAAEKAHAYRLGYQLYVEDQGMLGDQADHKRGWLWDKYDSFSRIIIAEVAGRVAGTARITWSGDHPFLGSMRDHFEIEHFSGAVGDDQILVASRLLIRPEFRGGSLSRVLLEKICAFAAAHGVDLVLIACEPHLVNHYKKRGFRSYGPLYNHPSNGIRVRMAMVVGHLFYQQEIGPPMIEDLFTKGDAATMARILTRITAGCAILSEVDGNGYLHEVKRLLGDINNALLPLLNLFGSGAETTAFLEKGHILRCNPGDMLIRKGHTAGALYMLLSGSLEMSDSSGIAISLTTVGTLVGTGSLFTGQRSVRDVVVGSEGAIVLAIGYSRIRELAHLYGPAVGVSFLLFGTNLEKRTEASGEARELRLSIDQFPIGDETGNRSAPRV